MKFTQTIFGLALSSLCSAPLSSAVAQTNNGFVGVFGDAAATIRCMQAAPGVPTTLYVVASTAGTTANGITGAEFRIEFTNPSGYFISYTAPSGAQALGDPVSSTGFNIAWPSCQMPSAGKVQLGTIIVFNAGSGSLTDIIVKRRNPPSNLGYQCALFVQCDSPVYTKSCMTAPPDSVSCLTQKAATPGPVLSEDEFKTTLDGSSSALAREYKGFLSVNDAGYERATCIIEKKNPTCGHQLEAWVDLNNAAATVWLQAGWYKLSTYGDVLTYYEHKSIGGVYQPVTGVAVPGAGGTTYRIRRDGTSVYIEAIGSSGGFSITLAWSDFHSDSDKLVGAEFSAEMHGGAADYTPGSRSLPCDFSSAGVRTVGGSSDAAPGFSPSSQKMCPEATNGRFGPIAADAFSIYDKRVE